MASTFEPWLKYSALTTERLGIVANIVKDARRETVLLHDARSGDTALSLGCRAYARVCAALRKAAERYDWLSILDDPKPLRFVFAIGGVPIRMYNGDPEDPPSKMSDICVAEQQAFEIDGVPLVDGLLRLAVVTDKNHQATGVALIEMTEAKTIIGLYEIPFLDAPEKTVPLVAPGISLPPASVEPLRDEPAMEETGSLNRIQRNAG
jgi:hypothetical protein